MDGGGGNKQQLCSVWMVVEVINSSSGYASVFEVFIASLIYIIFFWNMMQIF
jgi:hypothetical protein